MFWGGLSAKPQAMTPCTCTTGRGASLLLDEALRPPALWGLGHRFPLRLGDKVGGPSSELPRARPLARAGSGGCVPV